MGLDFVKTFSTIAILGVFIFGIFAFVITTQTDNDVSTPITDNELINDTYSDLNTNLGSMQTDAQTSSDTFGSITPSQTFGELEVTSVVSPTRIFKTIGVGIWNIFIQLPIKVLGVSPIVGGIISSIVILLLIIGIWAIWKGVINVA